MTSNQEIQGRTSTVLHDWSTRILILAASGILFLTEYPFEFSTHPKPYRSISPLLLGYGAKSGLMDVVLNILLFVPFGFALGGKLLERKNWKTALLYTAIVGFVFSYFIELSQLYIPQRDSGWEDVCTNTTGAVVGYLLFALMGAWVLGLLSRRQEALQRWGTPRRIAAILAAYFATWFFVSALLNRETLLDDWSSECFLVVGSAAGHRPWAGELTKLEVWDRALPKAEAEQITQSAEARPAEAPLLYFDFQESPPQQDNARLFIPFIASSAAGQERTGTADEFAGASANPVSDLIESLKGANQFSLRAVLQPARGPRPNGRILSLSQPSGFADLYLGQSSESLVLWFRSDIFSRRPTLIWKTPRILSPDQSCDALFTYDGTNVRFFLDGRQVQVHTIGPETALASYFRYPKQAELSGYRDLYYAFVFLPAGGLLGLAVTRTFARRFSLGAVAALVALDVLIAPLVLAWILMRGSHGPFSWSNVVLSAVIVILGYCWAKAEGAPLAAEVARSSR
jgi:hypothetical protein